MRGANGGNNYAKYQAQKRAAGKLVLKDPKAEAVVVFLAEGYSQQELPSMLKTYLDITTDDAEIVAILAKQDVQKRLAFRRQEVADSELDRKQPQTEEAYKQYALRKLWTWAKKEDARFSVKACEAILRASKQGLMPPDEAEDTSDPLADRLGEIMGDQGEGDGDGREGDE